MCSISGHPLWPHRNAKTSIVTVLFSQHGKKDTHEIDDCGQGIFGPI
jgi:hypothetical protein